MHKALRRQITAQKRRIKKGENISTGNDNFDVIILKKFISRLAYFTLFGLLIDGVDNVFIENAGLFYNNLLHHFAIFLKFICLSGFILSFVLFFNSSRKDKKPIKRGG